MNTNYYRNENWVDSTFSKRGKRVLALMAVVVTVGIIAGGCGVIQDLANSVMPKQEEVVTDAPIAEIDEMETPKGTVNVPTEDAVSLDVEDAEVESSGSMISYDVASVGRADPFMPADEIAAFNDARNSAIAEANAHNAKLAELGVLAGKTVRQPDDISPYSFNLPVPPTSLAPAEAAAAKITRTKVVGIMYNKTSPSAIVNVDDKDYLVRQGDKIIGQEYKVLEINPSWITVSLGSNVYSASIGELFSRDDLDKNQNDLYNLRDRFGGRKG